MLKTNWIWHHGDWVRFEDAKIHVLTHALHYGTGVFEGIRAYQTPQGPALFRVAEHYQRLLDSARIYMMPHTYTVPQLVSLTQALLKKNDVGSMLQQHGMESVYIRPLLYVGYGTMGLNPGKNPVELMIAAWGWGSYLGDEGVK